MKRVLSLLVVMLLALSPCYATTVGQIGGMDSSGNYHWTVEDGDIIPGATSSYDVGSTSYTVAEGHFDTIYLGGIAKTSWGSVVSPMTDAVGYTYTTDSGGDVRLYDAGYIALGAGLAEDTYILYDGNADDWMAGLDDSADDYVISYGSAFGTDDRLIITDDANNTIITIGDGQAGYDKYFVFDGASTADFYMGIDDTGGAAEDLFTFGTGSAVGTAPIFYIGASDLLVVNGIDAVGAVDIDVGSDDITDVTVETDGGTLVLDGTITLTDSEVISNATDDTVRIASNDAATVLEIYTPGTSNNDVTLLLTADADADAGDRMAICHDGATNSMFFQSDTASADTLATILTLAKTGVLTTTAAINAEIDDASNTTVTDVLNIQHFTSGTAGAGIGAGLTFDLENDAGTEEEHAYIDVVSAVATDGSEDTDLVIGVMAGGTVSEFLRIDTDNSATAGSQLVITQTTTETDAILDILSLANSTGTAAANTGLGITWDFEDAGGAEEQASLDVQLTTATDTAEDAAIIFSQQTAGAVAETLRIQGASSDTTSDYLKFTANTTETNGVTDVMVLATATGTATDNYGIGISFQPEDATGSEEVASLDIVQTTAARATNDTDFVFSQNVNGTITERVRFDADGSNIVLSGATPAITIGDAGEEDTKLVFDGNAQDFHVGLDDTADDLVIGVGSALGTTTAISIDENTDVTVKGNLTAEGCLDMGSVQTFTDEDATPDVSDGSYFITNTTTTTITDFDGTGILGGQVIVVESAGAITYDVTGSGLKGGSTDIVTADGDLTVWIYNGTDWLLISFMDLSDDLN